MSHSEENFKNVDWVKNRDNSTDNSNGSFIYNLKGL